LNKNLPYYITIFFCLWIGINISHGQGIQYERLNNWKSKTLAFQNDTLKLDSLGIVPNSEVLIDLKNNAIIDTSFYDLDYFSGILKFKKNIDSLRISYRTFPFYFYANTQAKSPQKFIRNDSLDDIYFPYIPVNKTPEFLDFDGLKYSGNFNRGISFGSNQDLVVNSAFDLQLSGKLGNGIEVLAALTDNNIPIQPEGNTQQLQNFDKIFIQVKKTIIRLLVEIMT
jgi:hypothetical protein